MFRLLVWAKGLRNSGSQCRTYIRVTSSEGQDCYSWAVLLPGHFQFVYQICGQTPIARESPRPRVDHARSAQVGMQRRYEQENDSTVEIQRWFLFSRHSYLCREIKNTKNFMKCLIVCDMFFWQST